MQNLLGVSIVNYKTAHLVIECLNSLYDERAQWPQIRIVIVDNASGDNSVERIRQHVLERAWQDQIEVIASERNGGYAYGNNLAFERLLAQGCEYLWLLNPDTRLLPGATEALLARLDSDPSIGVVGSRLEDEDGTPQVAAFNFPSPLGELVNTSRLGLLARMLPSAVVPRPIPSAHEPVDWVAGASMMLRAEVVRRVGLMDANYFLYYEEVDYCRAIQRAGFRIVYEPASRVIHHVGAATGISDMRKQAPRRPTYWFQSRQRYFQKNFGFGATLVADMNWIVAYISWCLRARLQRKERRDPPHFLRDFLCNASFVKGRVR